MECRGIFLGRFHVHTCTQAHRTPRNFRLFETFFSNTHSHILDEPAFRGIAQCRIISDLTAEGIQTFRNRQFMQCISHHLVMQ